MFENISKTVDNGLCIDRGLEPPESIRSCGIAECPFWESGQWSEVSLDILYMKYLNKKI